MNDMPFISVIICTRNRANSLRRTLDSIVVATQRMDRTWELVVVDNGSIDATGEVIESYRGRLPIVGVREEKAGLSNARNAGVRHATGEYLIWTDDDVVVAPAWLAAWAAGIAARPDCAVFGGRAVPVYEEPVQAWFPGNEYVLRGLLALRDFPDWTGIASDRMPFGLNYAIRAGEQRRYLYDPNLGVAPGRRMGGEEVAVIRAILANGGSGCWVWEATVSHLIPPERQTTAYIRQYYRALGYHTPINGVRSGLVGRAKGIARALLVWTRMRPKAGPVAAGAVPRDIAALVDASTAEGSLRRHLGMPPHR